MICFEEFSCCVVDFRRLILLVCFHADVEYVTGGFMVDVGLERVERLGTRLNGWQRLIS